MLTYAGKVGLHYYGGPFNQNQMEAVNELCKEFMEQTEFHEVVIFSFNQEQGIDPLFFHFSLRPEIDLSELQYLSFFFGNVPRINDIALLDEESGGDFDILGRITENDTSNNALFVGINYLPENGDSGTLGDLRKRIGEDSYTALLARVQQFVCDVAVIFSSAS